MRGAPVSGGRRRRLFFALWPGEREREALGAWQRALAPGLEGGARAVPPERLHLTLLFLGGVEEPARACLEEAAGRLALPGPFTLRLDRLGHWAGPRVLWAGGEAPAPLLELVGGLRRAAQGCALAVEERPFALHLTLFRKVRRPPPLPPPPRPLRWTVGGFVLAASRTLPDGARYELLRRWPLPSGDRAPARADKPSGL